METEIALLDVVALKEDLPKHGLLAGQVGTVVEQLGDDVLEVEFSDERGRTYGLVPIRASQLMRLVFTQSSDRPELRQTVTHPRSHQEPTAITSGQLLESAEQQRRLITDVRRTAEFITLICCRVLGDPPNDLRYRRPLIWFARSARQLESVDVLRSSNLFEDAYLLHKLLAERYLFFVYLDAHDQLLTYEDVQFKGEVEQKREYFAKVPQLFSEDERNRYERVQRDPNVLSWVHPPLDELRKVAPSHVKDALFIGPPNQNWDFDLLLERQRGNEEYARNVLLRSSLIIFIEHSRAFLRTIPIPWPKSLEGLLDDFALRIEGRPSRFEQLFPHAIEDVDRILKSNIVR